MVRLKNKKSNPNPETAFCTGHSRTFIIEFTPSRAWYNGSTSASQAEDEGSIPFARTKKSNRPCVGFIFWIVGDGREPDKVAPATQGSERSVHRTRSERGPPKSPRAPAIGLISAGNYTFPSPAQKNPQETWGIFTFLRTQVSVNFDLGKSGRDFQYCCGLQ